MANFYYAAPDSTGKIAAYVTNGTVAGTVIVAPGTQRADNLDPTEFTAGNGADEFFSGTDSNGDQGLWVTAGTEASTTEVEVGKQGTSDNLNPTELTFLGGGLELLVFAGTDSSGNEALWASNGSASGTEQILITNVDPTDLTLVPGVASAVFAGDQAPGEAGLWVTNGTSAGTTEIVAAPEGPFFLNPEDFTSVNSTLAFLGTDGTGHQGLWDTNGTPGGTSEILSSTQGGNYSSPTILYPRPPTAGGALMLFSATGASDTAGNRGLWVTNGTAAGTVEVEAGNQGSNNLAPLNVYHLNTSTNLYLFDGRDASGNYGLWATSGTAASTVEIEGGTQGVFSLNATNFAGPALGAAVFAAVDSSGNTGLWFTDGTAATTKEITPGTVSGTYNLNPEDLTWDAFAGQVLFAGSDSNGKTGLYASNGVNSTLIESGLQGARNLIPRNLTVVGGGALAVFAGGDSIGDRGLWATNGTAAGTSEILDGAQGAFDLNPTDFQIINGGAEVLFDGTDNTGARGLWVTNGTAGAGNTFELSKFGIVATGTAPAPAITNGALADSTEQRITGTIDSADASQTISIFDGAMLVGTATANSAGVWTAFASLSGSGPHALLAQATGVGGAVGRSKTQYLMTVGGETITFADGSGDIASLYNTAGNSDKVNGSHGVVRLNSAHASVAGGGDTVIFQSGSGNAVTLSGTASVLDAIKGSNGTIDLNGARASLDGDDNTIEFSGSANDAIKVTQGSGDTLDISASMTLAAGSIDNIAKIDIVSGVTANLSHLFTGKANAIAADIAGAGTLEFDGNATIGGATFSFAVAHGSVVGASTNVTLGENLGYAGAFHEGVGATLSLTGGRLVLTGGATFSGGTVDGSQGLVVKGTTAISGLAIGGTAVFENAKTVTQSGAVTLGDAAGHVAQLVNIAGATYEITNNSGIGRGAATGSHIVNAGLFEKTGGTGVSTILPAVQNTGTVEAKSGTLDLKGAISGTGSLTISGAAKLEAAAAVGSGQTARFTGSGGEFILDDAQGFVGKISGFGGTDKLDFGAPFATGTSIHFVENGAHTSGELTLTHGSSHATITLLGSYLPTDFHATSGASGTLITFT